MDATKAMNSIKKVLTAYPSHCCGRKRSVSFALFPLLFLFCLVLSSKASGQGFRAAVVKVDITPEDSQNLLGYLPTASAWQHEGYETTVSPYTPSAARDLTEAVIGYLQGEMRSKR